MRLRVLGLCLVGLGCTPKGGTMAIDVTMPPPSQPPGPGELGPSPGVVDSTPDDICRHLDVYIYKGRPSALAVDAVPPGVVPVLRGKALGTYRPESPKCLAAAVQVPPGNDYWVVVRLPASLYVGRGGRPSLSGTTAGIAVTGGLHPIVVREKQEARGALTVTEHQGVTDIAAPQ